MGPDKRLWLIAEFGHVMQGYQRAVDALDQRVADRLGLNRTDLRCLELLFAPEPLSPGELATASGLTTGGVTTAIDRLERAGYVRRERDTADRRRVIVRPTELAQRAVDEIYAPMVTDGAAYLQRFDDDTIENMIEMLAFSTRMQYEHAKRLSGS